MPTTTNGLPYPALSDPDNPPADIQALAQAIDGWGAWADYVPTLTNFPAATVAARFTRVGKMVTVRFCITLTAAATGGAGNMVMSTPTPTANPLTAITYGEGWGTCVMYDSSVGTSSRRSGTVVPVNTTSNTRVGFLVDSLASNALESDAVPWTWNTGDIIAGTFTYEAA